MSKTRNPFKRGGLHPLDCSDCSFYAYATIAALEQHGRPACPCGGQMWPREVELCELLELEDAPAVLEYRATIESIWHGQAPHLQKLGKRATLQDPHELAMSRIVTNRRADAQKRRLQALKPAQPAMPF